MATMGFIVFPIFSNQRRNSIRTPLEAGFSLINGLEIEWARSVKSPLPLFAKEG
jgi:hypothetical protein